MTYTGFPAGISSRRSRSSSTGMLTKPSAWPPTYSPGVRVSSSVTEPSRGRAATSSVKNCFTRPFARSSAMKPAMFTGSLAEE